MNGEIIPAGSEALAEMLREAAIDGQVVVPWGAGTLQHLGAPAPADALRLSTAALDQVLEYNPPDLTITVQAGVTLEALQATLAPHGQWLPWLPPAP
ncbi:MAG TPA: FAD-binding protein, partial [Roseiflexaceae bacterium]|nr:FAD-binding protein [Roseiflexaceae bacterium]